MERYCYKMAKENRDDNNNNERFFGFSDDEKNKSKTLYKSFKQFNRSVRYKVYKEVSLKASKKMNSRRNHQSLHEDHRKSIRRKQYESKYFTHNRSSYFLRQTKSASNKIIEEEERMNQNGGFSKYFFKPTNDFSIKIKEEHEIKCDHDTQEELEGQDFESEYFKMLKTEQEVMKVEQKRMLKTECDHETRERIEGQSKYFKVFQTKEEFIKTEQELMMKTENYKYSTLEPKPTIWVPPRSPHNLIEEVLHQDPWALLVATIFLNRTRCMCARPFVFWFLKENPHPLKVLEKYPEDLEKYFIKLGLQKTRAVQVWRMSHDFVFKDWKNVKELYGIGKYGEDAFRIFCRGDFSVAPTDRFLKIYKAWYQKVEMCATDVTGGK